MEKFSTILAKAIQHYGESKPDISQKYLTHLKMFIGDGCKIKYDFIIDYGFVLEYTTPNNFTYIIQRIWHKTEKVHKMLYDVYDDNIGGFNNIHHRASRIPDTEEEHFQLSTLYDVWFTQDEVNGFRSLEEDMENEYHNRNVR